MTCFGPASLTVGTIGGYAIAFLISGQVAKAAALEAQRVRGKI